MTETGKRKYGARIPDADKRRLNLDLPVDTAERLKAIADGIGVSVSEFLRMHIGGILVAYESRSDDTWSTDDSNPSQKVIQEVANLYKGRDDEFKSWSWRRIRREMVLYLEAEKLIEELAQKPKKTSKR